MLVCLVLPFCRQLNVVLRDPGRQCCDVGVSFAQFNLVLRILVFEVADLPHGLDFKTLEVLSQLLAP